MPALRIDTVWDVGEEKGWKIYFSTTPPIDGVGGFAIDLGATYNMPGVGIW